MSVVHVRDREQGSFAAIEGIVFDFDGTAVAGVHDRAISNRLIDAVASALDSGLVVSIATASKWLWVEEAATTLGIRHPVIASNGVIAMQPGRSEPIWDLQFRPGAVKALLAQLGPDVHLNINDDADHIRRNANDVATRVDPDSINYLWVPAIDRAVSVDLLSAIESIESMSVVAFESTIRSDSVDLVIAPSAANKFEGVKRLRAELDAHDHHWLGVGDGPNDVLLFEACQIGVAMGNATQHLKNVADFVTDSQPADGLAYVIEQVVADRNVNLRAT